MVTLTQLPDGCSGGPPFPAQQLIPVEDSDQSSGPSQPASRTSDTSIEDVAPENLALAFPNGRYDPDATTNHSGEASSSDSLQNGPRMHPPRRINPFPQASRGRGQYFRGSGRQHFNDRRSQGRSWRNGPQWNHHLVEPQRAAMSDRRDWGSGQSMAALSSDWNKYRSILITLSRVPEHTSTWDLWTAFSPLGNIVYIDIDENPKGERTQIARIRFDPPPKDPIPPKSDCQITVQGRKLWLMIEEVIPTVNEGGIRSPLNNRIPGEVILRPSSLKFGIMVEPTKFMSMRSVRAIGPDDVLSVTVDFRHRKLKITFPVFFEDKDRPELPTFGCSYRLEAKFESITKVCRVSTATCKAAVISFEYPPRFFRRKVDVERTHDVGRLSWSDQDVWARAVEITHDLEASKKMPTSLENNRQYIDLGRWTTYKVDLDPEAQDQWKKVEEALVDWNIKTSIENGMQFVPRAEPRLWPMIEEPAEPTVDLLALDERITLPFDVRYQLGVCISHGVIEERNVTREFLLKLQSLSAKKVSGQTRARLVLEYAADQKRRIYDPMTLFEDQGAMTYYPACTHVPPHCALVRKVTVTPTRIYYHTPSLETTNRVLRHYSHLQDNFVRVAFMDELNDGRINGSDTVRDNELYTRAFRVMNNGIRMGRWHWQFLAFGNSQIRENGAFFFCEEKDVTCNSIREWMGKFTHIRVVAKYAARLGQCFSTTRLLGGILAPTIVSIPDVERNGYCFTDGVGKISPILAKKIADEWKADSVPSAFQFRMGGCKGVLVASPQAKDFEVHIRKSQEKFSAEFNGLEIIRLSHYTTATLNRQTISILSCLGVPDQVFMDLLAQELRNYDRAMTDRAFACKLLRQYVDESQSSIAIAEMLEAGFMEANEPYCKAMLQLWRSFSIKYLKEKARIPIAESAFVLGVIDETGTLKGHTNKRRRRDDKPVKELPEIFLQISDPNNRGDPKIITGFCIVGRNPSMHPGDIRVVKAVDVPALRGLRDVVVFPMNGDRDIPSMCSGGDLDGDDFFVIWNQDLIPNEWFHVPMDFEAAPAKELDHVPTVQDLKVFFALYMKNNSLPLIAHAHLAHADFRDSGAKDPRCIELAKLHSKAVDYVKTGVPAEMEKKLQPKHYPHFMEKHARKTYHSYKILGQMYDAVNRVHFSPQYGTPFDARILKRYTPDNEMLKKARHLKTQYDTALKRIMGQMEIRTEFEVLSAFVMSKPLVGTQFKQHETVRRETDALKQQFKDDCIEAAGGSREFKVLAPFVAAMYQVTHEEVQIALYESRVPHVRKNGTQGYRRIKPESMPLISFPWLFDGILGRIARGASEEQQAKTSPAKNAKEAPSADQVPTPGLDHEDLKKMEYARTSSGVIHRGQILRLFHHEDEDELVDEDEWDGAYRQQEAQQQQRQTFSSRSSSDRRERQPTVDPNAGTRPSQKRPVNGVPNKLNNDKAKPKYQNLDNTITTPTASILNPGPSDQDVCLPAPNENLISFDSPPKMKQTLILFDSPPKQPNPVSMDSPTLSLIDMDEDYSRYVSETAKDQTTAEKPADTGSQSASVPESALQHPARLPPPSSTNDKTSLPMDGFLGPYEHSKGLYSNGATDTTTTAMSMVGALSSAIVNAEVEEENAKEKHKPFGSIDDGDAEDLEIEEVIIEKKPATSAFDNLARLA